MKLNAAAALISLVSLPAAADVVPASPSAPTTLAQSASFVGTALNVVDLDREIRFYTQALGARVAATLPAGTRSETILQFPGNPGQASILLMHDTTPTAPKRLNHGDGFSRLVIRVVDLAALALRLTQLGYAHGDLRAGGQGYRVMMMTDPEGYRLELVQAGPPRTGA